MRHEKSIEGSTGKVFMIQAVNGPILLLMRSSAHGCHKMSCQNSDGLEICQRADDKQNTTSRCHFLAILAYCGDVVHC